MRKKAQERKRNMSPSSSSSSLTYQSCYPDTPSTIGVEGQDLHGGGCITSILKGTPPDMDGYLMDQIWMEIEAPEAPEEMGFDGGNENACNGLAAPLPPPTAWEYYPDACWKMDDEIKMAPQFSYSDGVDTCF